MAEIKRGILDNIAVAQCSVAFGAKIINQDIKEQLGHRIKLLAVVKAGLKGCLDIKLIRANRAHAACLNELFGIMFGQISQKRT